MSEAALREAFRNQAGACADLGSPFMARLCTLLAERLQPGTPIADRLFAWEGDISPRAQSVPLRLAGALHALNLSGHERLGAVYPPHAPSDEALWSAVASALTEQTAFLDAWLDSPPQTNEVRRSAALIPAGHLLARRFGLPLHLSEMGASAGLNLMWDRFALEAGPVRLGPPDPALVLTPEWRGKAPEAADVRIAERRGVDLNPLSPQTDSRRLTAYLWPDQPHRLELTRAAMSVAVAEVDRADAGDWALARLADAPEGRCHMLYSTIALQYFPQDVQHRIAEGVRQAGERASASRPLAWMGMEPDENTPGAGLFLHVWPGDERIDLGRADFHGRWIEWRG